MAFSFVNVLLFALASALGALTRHGLNSLACKLLPRQFPWGIFIVNVLGCFAFGIVFGIDFTALDNTVVSDLSIDAKNILLLGFMGSFTTFSSFIFDCHELWSNGHKQKVILNILGQILLGLLAFILGYWLMEF